MENKYIVCQGVKMELTDERRKRIIEAQNETQRKLDRELSYSDDLQHKDMIAFYRDHIARLASMLS